MLSRVADSIYWMAHYVERAENLARFIDVTLNLLLDQPQDAGRQWAPLVNTTGDDAYFAAHYQEIHRFTAPLPELWGPTAYLTAYRHEP